MTRSANNLSFDFKKQPKKQRTKTAQKAVNNFRDAKRRNLQRTQALKQKINLNHKEQE
jgi:hypothetical protein